MNQNLRLNFANLMVYIFKILNNLTMCMLLNKQEKKIHYAIGEMGVF